MIGLDGIGRVARPAASGARAVGRGAGFSVPAARAGGTAAMAGPVEIGLAGMLALQEAEAAEVRDREARRHGRQMLDGLARLQRALLDGAPDQGTLLRLAALVEVVPGADDPALAAAMAEVTLRVRVELARHAHVISC